MNGPLSSGRLASRTEGCLDPRETQTARNDSKVTSAVDLLATVHTLGGIPATESDCASGPPRLDADLNPFPIGAQSEVLGDWEDPGELCSASQRCLRSETHKLVHQTNSDEGELYDLVADSRETRDLYNNESACPIRERMTANLPRQSLPTPARQPKSRPLVMPV